jgi:hypothetical protein
MRSADPRQIVRTKSTHREVPNNRINFAPAGRPTRKVRCTLLAGYAKRWASEGVM